MAEALRQTSGNVSLEWMRQRRHDPDRQKFIDLFYNGGTKEAIRWRRFDARIAWANARRAPCWPLVPVCI
jgi:hypothetical protein